MLIRSSWPVQVSPLLRLHIFPGVPLAAGHVRLFTNTFNELLIGPLRSFTHFKPSLFDLVPPARPPPPFTPRRSPLPTPNMASSLPPEIITMIVDHLVDEYDGYPPQDLVNLALVSRAFLEPARAALYHTIALSDWVFTGVELTGSSKRHEFNQTSRIAKLVRTLQGHRSIADLVRAVCTGVPWPDPCDTLPEEEYSQAQLDDIQPAAVARRLPEILASCRNIRVFDTMVFFQDGEARTSYYAKEVIVKHTMSLEALCFHHDGDIKEDAQFLQHCDVLRRLELRFNPCSGCRDMSSRAKMDPSTASVPFKLEALQLEWPSPTLSPTFDYLASASATSLRYLELISREAAFTSDISLAGFSNLSHVELQDVYAYPLSDHHNTLLNFIDMVTILPSLTTLILDALPHLIVPRNTRILSTKHLRNLPQSLRSLILPSAFVDPNTFFTLLNDNGFLPCLKELGNTDYYDLEPDKEEWEEVKRLRDDDEQVFGSISGVCLRRGIEEQFDPWSLNISQLS